MSSTLPMTPFLRRVLIADALSCAAAGAVMALGARVLPAWLGLPGSLLLAAGSMLLPYSLLLLWLARRTALPRPVLGVVIACNVLWAIDCAAVVLGSAFAPSRLGVAFVVAQALTVLAFAELEFVALRRARAATAA